MRVLLMALVVVFFASCRTTNIMMEKRSQRDNSVASLDSVFFHEEEYQYHIRPDDKISIGVWGQDEVSVGSVYGIYNSNEIYGKWLLVDVCGNIEVPRIGTLYVENMTVIQLKKELKRLFAEWIVNPVVDVKVLNKKITVLGEVRNPQIVQVDEEENSLLELVAHCNGFADYANLKYVKILRQHGEDVHIANIDLSQPGEYFFKNIQIHPGDIVIVPSKKHKEFDKRISVIVPFTSTITAAAVLLGTFR